MSIYLVYYFNFQILQKLTGNEIRQIAARKHAQNYSIYLSVHIIAEGGTICEAKDIFVRGVLA